MNFTEQEQDYYELILDMLDDGTIEESERALLNKRKAKYGLSDERVKEIENFALQGIKNKNKPKFNTEGEKEYYELLEDILENGIIDESGRSLLNKRKAKYGISDERAKEFEDYIKGLKGIYNSNNDLLEQGKLYYNDGDYEEAIKCFNKAVELNPNDADNWYWLGHSYNQNENYKEAIRCLNKAVELEPNDANNWNWLGSSYNKDGNYEEAIRCLNKAVELEPNDANNWNWLGSSYNKDGNYEEAIRCLKKAVELEPNDSIYWYCLGRSYNDNGNYEEAMLVCNKAIEIDPIISELLKLIGLSRLINGTVENTLYLLKRELEIEYEDNKLKNITDRAFMRIKWLIDNPIYDEDSNYYNYPTEFFILSENIIGYLFGFERYSDVIYLKRKLFNIRSRSENDIYIDDIYVLIMCGRAYIGLENYDKAIDQFNYLMRHYELDDEKLASVWFYLGYCHCELGYLEESKNDYENAIELDDNDSMYWNNYGVTLSRMGYAADAREAYQKALEIDPNNELAMNNLNSLRHNNSDSGGFISDIISGISDLFK